MTFADRLARCLPLLAALLAPGLAPAALPIQHWVTEDGARVYFVESHDLPLLDVSVEFPAGSARDGAETSGLASLTRRLMSLGAGGMSEDDISRSLADVGADLGGRFDEDRAGWSVRTLSSERERTRALEVFARILQRPEFPEAVLEREKARTVAGIREARTKPDYIAGRAFRRLVYGEHPYALDEGGEAETVEKLGRADLEAFYRRHYVAGAAVVAIMGDLTRAQAEDLARQLTAGLPKGDAPPALPPVPAPGSGETARIAHPAKQAHILMGMPVMSRHDPDYFPLLVGNYTLGGGGFVSRLTTQIREKRGLAYSVYSYFQPMAEAGPFVVGLQTKKEQADQALELVRGVVREYVAKGPTEKELRAAKDNIVGGFPLRLDSNKKIVEYLAVIGFYRLPLSFLDDYVGKVEKVSVADIRRAWQRRVSPDLFDTVVVGAQ